MNEQKYWTDYGGRNYAPMIKRRNDRTHKQAKKQTLESIYSIRVIEQGNRWLNEWTKLWMEWKMNERVNEVVDE